MIMNISELEKGNGELYMHDFEVSDLLMYSLTAEFFIIS